MDLADDVVVRDEHVIEEDFAEAGVAAELRDRSHGDAVGLQVEHEVRQSAVALGIRIGAEQPEGALSERRP